jgi:hypothetical protein
MKTTDPGFIEDYSNLNLCRHPDLAAAFFSSIKAGTVTGCQRRLQGLN